MSTDPVRQRIDPKEGRMESDGRTRQNDIRRLTVRELDEILSGAYTTAQLQNMGRWDKMMCVRSLSSGRIDQS